MKIKLLTLLLLLFGLPSYAQHDFQLLVGLNMKDCISCVGGQLDQIEKLNNPNKDVDIYLVIGKEYAIDSSLIINKYNLYGITKRIIWSDKLLKKITNGGSSSILFFSKYGTLTYRFPLETFPKYLLNYIDRAGLPLDSLFSDYPDIALGLSQVGVGKIYVNEGKVYFINSLAGGVNGYDLLSGKKVSHFRMTDSLLKITFPYSGLPASQCDIQHKLLQHAHFAPYQINGLGFSKDTIYVRFENDYLVAEKSDSVVKRDNVCVLKVVNGNVSCIYRYPYCFTNGLDNQRLYCTHNTDFYYYKNAMYNFIYVPPNIFPYKPYYVVGRFEPDKNNFYKLTKLSEIKNPPMYQHLACENLYFDKGYFSFPLIDTLFSVTGGQPNIPLNYLPTGSDAYEITNPCTSGVAIRAFKMTDSIIWVAIQKQNSDLATGTVLKYNRNTKKIERSKILLHDMWTVHISFDPIDPDFVLYTTSTSERLYSRSLASHFNF